MIPVLYHLFELCEPVIAAVPDYDMVRDKWETDIEPVIARTRYRDLLPASGKGAKGGMTMSIHFRHGPHLRFMTAGGRDKSRAGFTSRVVCMTETDGFDVRTSTSDEADKIEQIEARTRSFPLHRQRIYKECTVTTEEGHTWRRYQAGTCSKIVMPCQHCQAWVSPEREHFHGWQDAETDVQAIREAQFHCPSCGEAWTEPDRAASNHAAKVIHAGQTLTKKGKVKGPQPDTITLGFRWSAVNNLLVPASNVALDEWKAKRATDEDNEERKLCQFVWCLPYRPLHDTRLPLTVEGLQKRQSGLGKGQMPPDTYLVTVGVDVNQPVLHWTAIAWTPDGSGYVIDYGTQGVKHLEADWPTALKTALTSLQSKLGLGWTPREPVFDRIAVDCRWETDACIASIKSFRDPRWRPFMGLGAGHWARSRPVPQKYDKATVWLGERAYERVIQKHGAIVMYADANFWKTWLHRRLVLEPTDGELPAGAIRLYDTSESSPHRNFARHLTAEREVEKFEPGKGYQKVWEAMHSHNHWLDATYIACVLASRHPPQIRRAPKAAPVIMQDYPGLLDEDRPVFNMDVNRFR